MIEQARYQVAHLALLRVDAAGAVDDPEAVLAGQPVVLLQHPSLEQPEALDRVGGQAEVHAGFVELDLGARAEPATQELNLRTLARAVDSLDDDQPAPVPGAPLPACHLRFGDYKVTLPGFRDERVTIR